MRRLNVVTGFVLAPLATPLLVVLASWVAQRDGLPHADHLVGTFLITAPYAYGVTLVCGIPGYCLGRRHGWLTSPVVVGSGLLVGLALSLLLGLAKRPFWLVLCPVSGGVSAACFWIIACRPLPPSLQSAASYTPAGDGMPQTSLCILLACLGLFMGGGILVLSILTGVNCLPTTGPPASMHCAMGSIVAGYALGMFGLPAFALFLLLMWRFLQTARVRLVSFLTGVLWLPAYIGVGVLAEHVVLAPDGVGIAHLLRLMVIATIAAGMVFLGWYLVLHIR